MFIKSIRTKTNQNKNEVLTMSHDGHEQWLESEKRTFADDHPEFKEHLQDLEHFNNHPSLSAYERNRSLAD